jgi:hypothetical protein
MKETRLLAKGLMAVTLEERGWWGTPPKDFESLQQDLCTTCHRLNALSYARQHLTRRLRSFLVLALVILVAALGFLGLVSAPRVVGILVILGSVLLAVATHLMVIEMAREL